MLPYRTDYIIQAVACSRASEPLGPYGFRLVVEPSLSGLAADCPSFRVGVSSNSRDLKTSVTLSM